MAGRVNANVAIDRVAINAVASLAGALNREIGETQLADMQAEVRALQDKIHGEDAQKVLDLYQDAIDTAQTARENFSKFHMSADKIAKAMDATFDGTARSLDQAQEELKRAKGQLAARASS